MGPCTVLPSYSYDSSFCSSIGTYSDIATLLYEPSSTSITITEYYRYYSFTSPVGGRTSYLLNGFPTDFDRCLPGPTTCSLTYTGGGKCPDGHTGLSTVISDGATTEYCCPSATVLSFRMYQSDIYTTNVQTMAGSRTTTFTEPTTMNLCEYAWTDPSVSVLPTMRVTEAPYLNNILWLRALAIVHDETTTTSSGAIETSQPPTQSASPASSSPGTLSKNTKIGIGVGVSLGGLLFISLFVPFLILYRRKLRKNGKEDISKPFEKAELDGRALESHKINAEVPGAEMSEMPRDEIAAESAAELVHEMPDTGVPAEIGQGNARSYGSEKLGNVVSKKDLGGVEVNDMKGVEAGQHQSNDRESEVAKKE